MKKSERKVYVSIDLSKAFDSISRTILFTVLRNRAQSPDEHHIVNLLINLFRKSELDYDGTKITVTKGVQQGSVLSPLLFNVYLDHCLKGNPELLKAMK